MTDKQTDNACVIVLLVVAFSMSMLAFVLSLRVLVWVVQ